MSCDRGVRPSGSQSEPPYGELAAMASFHGAPNALVETLVGPYHVRASIRGRTLAVRITPTNLEGMALEGGMSRCCSLISMTRCSYAQQNWVHNVRPD